MQNNQYRPNIDSSYPVRRKSVFWYALMSFLMFFYIYEFNFDAFGLSTYLTSRRVSVFILIILAFFSGKKFFWPQGIAKKTLNTVIWFHVFLFIYSLVLLALVGRGTGSHVSDSILRLFLFGILPVFCFLQLFDSVEEFLYVVLIATLVQAGFILASLANPAFGEMLDITFSSGDNTEYLMGHRSGYAGGIACITAPGCLRFSMGVVAAFYFAIKRNAFIPLLVFIVLSIIGTMVARTGMFIGLIGLIIISIRQGANNFFKYILIVILAFLAFLFFNNQIDIIEYFDFHRLEDLLFGTGGTDFVEGYFSGESTHIPPLTAEMVLYGTGIDSGVSGTGIQVNVDGGFLRLYAAYGLIICVLFYFVMFKCFLKNAYGTKDNIIKTTLLFFIIVILIGEMKEYTIYQQYMVGLFFTCSALVNKSLNT